MKVIFVIGIRCKNNKLKLHYWCEGWAMKKVECQRIDVFELCCWRRILRTPCTARRSNQRKSTLNIYWKDWSWRWSSSILATWFKDTTHLKRPWCWESLKAGGEGDNRGLNGWIMSLTQWTWVRQALEDGEGQGSLACCSPWGRKESDTTEWLNWTDS